MISGYHLEVAEHYEKFPYPHYPLFAMASWRALQRVDVNQWGAKRAIEDIWIAGCGTIAPLMFARRNFFAKIVASDLSPISLRICLRRLRLFGMYNVQLKQEDLFESRYTEAFDAVDCYGVLHHTISPVKSLEKLAQSLRSGGVLRLMVYSKHARSEIEQLRSLVIQGKIADIGAVEKLLKEKEVKRVGDLSSREGRADALLNPIVHTFSKGDLDSLFSQVPQLEILRIDAKDNFIVFARKG